MQVIITGGGGYIGKRLAARLLADGELAGRPIEKLSIADISDAGAADWPADPRLEWHVGDFTRSDALRELLNPQVGVIYHLAAVVSGAAEQDFDLGMRVNLYGTLHLLEACRALGTRPRVVFTSSVAVFGGTIPDVLRDDTHLTPQNSYGTQKAVGELLLGDYSRKGFVDGRALRLPTVVVRPGLPNAAASSFASGIVREPLNGEEAICPVSEDTELWLMSTGRAIDALVHAAGIDADTWGPGAGLSLPGLTVSVREILDALREVGGDAAVARVRFRRDPAIERIVGGWAVRFDPQRALALGFCPDRDMAAMIRAYVDEELDGRLPD